MTDPSQPNSAKAQILNDRTYQEVEYLKKNLGPILVAALAEICIRRPADPIEYLGHWLLRWRYNEELKRRDVQNALEVVRQKAWTKDDENLQPNPNAPNQPPSPQTFTQGFVPGAAYAPPGYGGPLDQNVVDETLRPEGAEESKRPDAEEVTPTAASAEGVPWDEAQVEARRSGDAWGTGSGEKQQLSGNEIDRQGEQNTSGGVVTEDGRGPETKSSPTSQGRRSGEGERERQGSGAGNQRTSLPGQGQRASRDAGKVASGEQAGERRSSRKSDDKRAGSFDKPVSGQDVNNQESSRIDDGEEEERRD